MFDNVGGKIKVWAKINFFAIYAIIILIPAIIAGSIDGDGVVGFLAALVGATVGYPLAWTASAALYAFGQLVQDNEVIKRTIVSIQEQMNTNNVGGNASMKSKTNQKNVASITSDIDELPDL